MLSFAVFSKYGATTNFLLTIILIGGCHAFVPIHSSLLHSHSTCCTTSGSLHRLQPLQLSPFQDNPLSYVTTLVAIDDDVAFSSFDDAFQDQITFMDDSVKILVAVFGVVIAVLAVLSFVSSKVDDAIYQTLQDFEATMRQYFPQRWETIEAQLADLSPEERDVKLLQIMEEMQEKEPAVMNRVREKMDF